MAAPPAEGSAVPPDFAWVTSLGAARAVALVPTSRRIVWGSLIIVAWAFAVLLGGTIGGLMIARVLGLADPAGLVIAGAVWAVAFGTLGYWLGGKAFQCAVLYEQGVAVKDGRRIRAWPWDRIVSVERRPSVSRPEIPTDVTSLAVTLVVIAVQKAADRPLPRVDTTYRFRDAVGRSFTLDRWLSDADSIAEEVDAQVSRRLSPSLRAELDAGGAVAFGAITISRAGGISLQKRTVAWADLHHVEVDRDALRLYGHDGGRLGSVSINDLRNLSILLELILQLASSSRAENPKT